MINIYEVEKKREAGRVRFKGLERANICGLTGPLKSSLHRSQTFVISKSHYRYPSKWRPSIVMTLKRESRKRDITTTWFLQTWCPSNVTPANVTAADVTIPSRVIEIQFLVLMTKLHNCFTSFRGRHFSETILSYAQDIATMTKVKFNCWKYWYK
jgi:hypothetical protein